MAMAAASFSLISFIPFSSFNPSRRRHLRRQFSISCGSVDKSEPPDRRTDRISFKLLELSVTLTAVSSSLSLSPAIAAAAKTSSKKKKSTKTEGLSPEELKLWSRDLPTVGDRIPYTEILNLKQEGKLKHIIKRPSSSKLMTQSESVLVVLDDLQVLRTVLPSVARDPNFWDAWDELNLSSVCINAYTPPVHVPVHVPATPSPNPVFLSNLLKWLFASWKKPPRPSPPPSPPKSRRALELERARKKLVERREAMRLREEMIKKAMAAKKREEQKKRDRELRIARHENRLHQAEMHTKRMSAMWYRLAHDQNFSTALGIVFFYIFYRTVVLSYRKNQKDYEDRLKIEKAEAEERRKMKELERELAGLEPYDGEDENEGSEKEKDPYREIMKFMKSGARVRRAEPRKLPQYLDKTLDVKFSDIAGLGELRFELEEIVKFFTHGDVYRRRGIKIPGGILLCGAPGVGKTMLAKAVAGEAGVNFFSISASQFVEIYVGVGASRVRALYQEAKEFAPSVVFIDELDAVGRKRGTTSGSGGQERDATLNQLLVCLDGFEGKGNVITIAATNRPDILDQALVRPGRFDRKIYIPKPTVLGRAEILKVHACKKPMAKDVDYVAVAGATEGMAGAELANIVEIAAMFMIRDGRSEITTDDLLQAAEMEERGMLVKKERSPEQWRQMALYQASMTAVALNFPELKKIQFLTIAPRAGNELGYVRTKMDLFKFSAKMMSRQSTLDYITVQLAPRAAEEIWFGEDKLSTICAQTTNNARCAARSFVFSGLSTKYYGLADFWTVDRINEVDSEALHILNICYDRAKQILMRNQKLVDAVTDELFQKKNLTKQELFQLVEAYGNLEPMPPDIVSLTMEKRVEFQEMMVSRKEASTLSSP